MSLPTSRQQLKEYCLRRLGYPVIKINVSDEQLEDRIDDALKYYQDYHFDGTEKQYYKHRITANNFQDRVYDLTVASGGTGYQNTDSVVFTAPVGANAAASIVTNANGSIVSATLSNNGINYAVAPDVTVQSNTGSNAVITSRLGGWIQIPENIIGVVNLYPIGSSITSVNNMFNIRYQIALNDLYTLNSINLVPYYMAMQHLRVIEEVLVGSQPMRYNRHRNQLYIDMDWTKVAVNDFILIEAYQVVDPEQFTDVWSDRWLLRYVTALFKRQWGENMTKFNGMQLPGGISFNLEQKYQEAVEEIQMLEDEMLTSYSLPANPMVG